jgi:hypothetical protein
MKVISNKKKKKKKVLKDFNTNFIDLLIVLHLKNWPLICNFDDHIHTELNLIHSNDLTFTQKDE